MKQLKSIGMICFFLVNIFLFTGCESVNERRARRKANKAVTMIKSDQFFGAEKLIKEAITLDPKNAHHRFLLGWLYQKRALYPQAIRQYQRASLLSTSFYRPYFELGNLHYARKNFVKAAVNYEKVLTLKPSHIKSLYHLALSYHKSEEYEKAAIYYDKTILLKPKKFLHSAFYGLASVYYDQAQKIEDPLKSAPLYEKSGNVVQRALREQIETIRLYNVLGMVYQAQKKYELALHTFQKAKKKNPYKSSTAYHIGNTYDRWLKSINEKLKTEKSEAQRNILRKDAYQKLTKALDAFKEFNQLSSKEPSLAAAVRSKIFELQIMEEKERARKLEAAKPKKRRRRRRRRR